MINLNMEQTNKEVKKLKTDILKILTEFRIRNNSVNLDIKINSICRDSPVAIRPKIIYDFDIDITYSDNKECIEYTTRLKNIKENKSIYSK